MNSLLDLELLRTFVTVVEAGELKKAARLICRSQAAVSMQIKRLEEQLGTSLMERSNQGIRLTESGVTLLGYSEQFLRLNRATLSALAEPDFSDSISFGIPTDYAQGFLDCFMPLLIAELPDLEARICCDRSRNLRKRLAAGDLDIAIVAGEPRTDNERLLWSERMLWCAPFGVRLEDQEELPVALYEDDCIVRDLALEELKRSGVRYRRVFSSSVLDNVAAAVRAGFAVSLLPESLARSEQIRPLPGRLLASNSILKMNMICSPRIGRPLQDKLGGCLQAAAEKLP